MGTKKVRIYGKGAPFKGAPQRFGGSCPKLPPLDPPLDELDELERNAGNSNSNLIVKSTCALISLLI